LYGDKGGKEENGKELRQIKRGRRGVEVVENTYSITV